MADKKKETGDMALVQLSDATGEGVQPAGGTRFEPQNPVKGLDDIRDLVRQQRLRDRDYRIIQWTGATGYSQVDQVAQVFFGGNRRTCARRMRQLFDYGMLGRTACTAKMLEYGLSRQVVYVVERGGVMWMKDAEEDLQRYHCRKAGGYPIMTHNLLVGEAAARILEAARDTLDGPVAFGGDRMSLASFQHQTRWLRIMPDGFLAMTGSAGQPIRMFLELDTGTERLDDFTRKNRLYTFYHASKEWQNRWPSLPPVVVITAAQGDTRRTLAISRRDRIARHLAGLGSRLLWYAVSLYDVNGDWLKIEKGEVTRSGMFTQAGESEKQRERYSE